MHGKAFDILKQNLYPNYNCLENSCLLVEGQAVVCGALDHRMLAWLWHSTLCNQSSTKAQLIADGAATADGSYEGEESTELCLGHKATDHGRTDKAVSKGYRSGRVSRLQGQAHVHLLS